MDRIIRCITTDGALTVSVIDSTETVMVAQQVHSLSATTSAVLGRTLTAASLMGAMLKQENADVTLKLNGGGPVGNVVAISDSRGNVRGYVDHPLLELPLRADGKLDVGGAVGKEGLLGVIRNDGSGEPYLGQIELSSGEVAEDVTRYYAVSEQIPTVCALGVLTEKQSHGVLLAGGFLAQALPGAYESDLARLEENLQGLDSVTAMMAKGMKPEAIAERVLRGFSVEKLDEMPVHYACTCKKEKFLRALITLGREEILSLPTQNGLVEAVCPYCNRKYYFDRKEIQQIAELASR